MTNQGTPSIIVDGLVKRFRVPKRASGLAAALRALFSRHYDDVVAVDNLSFEVPAGACIGLLGANGAGKTTTLKCLAGLLHPDQGRVHVLGHRPHERKSDYLRAITLVMGQKRLLSWDLPAADTFELQRVVYGITLADYRQRLHELVELLAIGAVMQRPVRQLSLGERMKCELAAAMLHQPQVLFLDEPTIGMDVSSQHHVREFVRTYAQRHGATVILTSHYMEDVVALCSRVLVIAGGKLCFDGAPDAMAKAIHPKRRLVVKAAAGSGDWEILQQRWPHAVLAQVGELSFDLDAEQVGPLLTQILELVPQADVAVAEMPFEEVMRRFLGEVANGGR